MQDREEPMEISTAFVLKVLIGGALLVAIIIGVPYLAKPERRTRAGFHLQSGILFAPFHRAGCWSKPPY